MPARISVAAIPALVLVSVVVVATLGAVSTGAQAAPPTDVKVYCASKWTDYSMQAFCIKQEQAAQTRLSRGVDDQAIWSRCYHKWDSWEMVDFGVGQIAEGMHRAGWDLQLTEYGDGHWRATFYVTGQAHSIVGGSAWELAPWTAVQRAALAALSEKTQ